MIWGVRFFYQYKTMNTDATMVSMQEVDENMALVQKNVSLIIDVHQNEINKLKKQLQEEQQRNNEREEDIIENYFANLKLRETTWKEWERMEERNKLLEEKNTFYVHGFKHLCEKYEGDGEWSFAEVEMWIDNLEEENKKLKM